MAALQDGRTSGQRDLVCWGVALALRGARCTGVMGLWSLTPASLTRTSPTRTSPMRASCRRTGAMSDAGADGGCFDESCVVRFDALGLLSDPYLPARSLPGRMRLASSRQPVPQLGNGNDDHDQYVRVEPWGRVLLEAEAGSSRGFGSPGGSRPARTIARSIRPSSTSRSTARTWRSSPEGPGCRSGCSALATSTASQSPGSPIAPPRATRRSSACRSRFDARSGSGSSTHPASIPGCTTRWTGASCPPGPRWSPSTG